MIGLLLKLVQYLERHGEENVKTMKIVENSVHICYDRKPDEHSQQRKEKREKRECIFFRINQNRYHQSSNTFLKTLKGISKPLST